MELSRRKFTRGSFEVNPNLLHRWRRDFQHAPEYASPGLGQKRADGDRAAELERKVGQQAPEMDFLQKCWRRIEEQRKLQAFTGKPPSISRSGKK